MSKDNLEESIAKIKKVLFVLLRVLHISFRVVSFLFLLVIRFFLLIIKASSEIQEEVERNKPNPSVFQAALKKKH